MSNTFLTVEELAERIKYGQPQVPVTLCCRPCGHPWFGRRRGGECEMRTW